MGRKLRGNCGSSGVYMPGRIDEDGYERTRSVLYGTIVEAQEKADELFTIGVAIVMKRDTVVRRRIDGIWEKEK